MSNEFQEYAKYFTVGLKVGVGIPLPNAEVFRDWAIIHSLEEDLVTIQLSRDELPVNVHLHVGSILELRGGTDLSGYCCRAIIVSEGDSRFILLRLIGEVVSDELREFYRIDAFLPIKYYITKEQHSEILQKEWETRRETRKTYELERKKKYRWDSTFVSDASTLPDEKRLSEDENSETDDDSWDTIIPLAANISGGGIRIITHHKFEGGEYALLEILVPSPRRIVDVVARIAFCNRTMEGGHEQTFCHTGMQFVFIDERDRDAILNHISNVQLKRIRQLREKYVFRGEGREYEENSSDNGFNWMGLFKKTVVTILVLVIIGMIGVYFKNYATNKPKNEIEEMFENSLRKYLEKLK